MSNKEKETHLYGIRIYSARNMCLVEILHTIIMIKSTSLYKTVCL